jgi:hypothetical protein
MIEFTIEEIYKLSSDKMFLELLDPDYCSFLTDIDDNIISYYYENINTIKESSIIETKAVSILKPVIPDILKSFFKNSENTKFVEFGNYDLLNNSATFSIESKMVDLINTSIKYSFTISDIDDNLSKKILKFKIECNHPLGLFNGTIEKIIKNDIIEKSKIRNNYINMWVDKKYY